jgi:hypothetical protein
MDLEKGRQVEEHRGEVEFKEDASCRGTSGVTGQLSRHQVLILR